MIADVDRYHGVVLRQILVGHGRPMTIATADRAGRVDCFVADGAAFQIKHSSKRLSPWQFTYPAGQFEEIVALGRDFEKVWIMLVCGLDGVVALPLAELTSIVQPGEGGVVSLRVRRSRHSMYRVGGSRGELQHPKPRGVQPFLIDVLQRSQAEP